MAKQKTERRCRIDGGGIEAYDGGSDGAYDLFHVEGSPDEIGAAISESLKVCDLWSPAAGSVLEDNGRPVFLTLRIQVIPVNSEFLDDDDD